ncbi:hypothetical protein AVEN_198490-1 [Araneus ventricosus]|uniref:Uncharacterized protein n=1 Tax=Araneus ventricosus TaxID=182803 RepID=A0A4Y2JKX6_ARAVE|nr:hypothetical protein AVEN_198490-1 [Araneus ventricosus]
MAKKTIIFPSIQSKEVMLTAIKKEIQAHFLKIACPLNKYEPPAHSWYRNECPGASIHFKADRKGHTAMARLTSGHLKTLRFSRGDKKFNICTKCNMIEATSQHLLDCVALAYNDLPKRPDFVLEVMKANDLMDLI